MKIIFPCKNFRNVIRYLTYITGINGYPADITVGNLNRLVYILVILRIDNFYRCIDE